MAVAVASSVVAAGGCCIGWVGWESVVVLAGCSGAAAEVLNCLQGAAEGPCCCCAATVKHLLVFVAVIRCVAAAAVLYSLLCRSSSAAASLRWVAGCRVLAVCSMLLSIPLAVSASRLLRLLLWLRRLLLRCWLRRRGVRCV